VNVPKVMLPPVLKLLECKRVATFRSMGVITRLLPHSTPAPHRLTQPSADISPLSPRKVETFMAKAKSSGKKYGEAAGKSVESAVRREKKGTLRSGKGGKGGKVTSRKQAIAIGLSEARKRGAKVPKKQTA
jgi:hypothetical protein